MVQIQVAVPPPIQVRQYEPGGVGRRLLANMIDTCVTQVLQFPADVVLAYFFGFQATFLSDAKQPWDSRQNLIEMAIGFLITFFYFGWFNSRKGGTPGKLLMKIVFLGLFLIDALVAIFRTDKRAVHDLICNTKVLRIRN